MTNKSLSLYSDGNPYDEPAAEASYFHNLFQFMDQFKDNPNQVVSDLIYYYPKDSSSLLEMLIKESSKPALLRK